MGFPIGKKKKINDEIRTCLKAKYCNEKIKVRQKTLAFTSVQQVNFYATGPEKIG